MVTPRNYAKLCNAQLLNNQLVAAGITQNPTVGFKMYGVSVDPTPLTIVYVIDSLSAPDGVTIDNVVAAHVNTPIPPVGFTLIFRADGYFRLFTTGTIDIQECPFPFTISQVAMRREIAGTGGQTRVDILKNGVSLWNVNPNNRPVVTAAAGNQARVVFGAPDVVSIAQGDRLEMSIVETETGSPQDILLQLIGMT